ncbi:MAG: hypothetical protein QOI21_1147 [Actinomycetota bacterium]|jgi:hypothetical protein|nr:hypothetical protein [Actinomycetota bacterium]
MQSPQVSRRRALLPLFAVSAMAVGAVLILLLQVMPPTDTISPISRTISEYALGPSKWIFDIALALVALGSVIGFGALIRQRRVAVVSAASVFCALWTISLLVIVAYPKNNWAVGPSMGGTIHRMASVVAFVCLPIAVLLASRTVFAHAPVRRRVSVGLAIGSLLWFGVIIGAIVVAAANDDRWWTLIPLGLVERLMALTGLLAISSLVLPARLDMTQVQDEAGRLRAFS